MVSTRRQTLSTIKPSGPVAAVRSSKKTKVTAKRNAAVVKPGPAGKRASSKIAPARQASSKPVPARKPITKLGPARRAARAPTPPINALPAPAQAARYMFGWGGGEEGQHGRGQAAAAQLNAPRRNRSVNTIELEAIAAGGMHTLLIDEFGTVRSCGVNDNYALGREATDDGFDLLPVEALVKEGFRAVRVTAGDNISAAVSDSGALRIWGTFRNADGSTVFSPTSPHQVLPTSIDGLESRNLQLVAAEAGPNHLVLLTTTGAVYAIGLGADCELGRHFGKRREMPSPVSLNQVTLGRSSAKAVAIGSGYHHSFAVDDKGHTWAWGMNDYGQTGTGVVNDAISPRRVHATNLIDDANDVFVQITGGRFHSVFLTRNGNVYTCGLADEGRLGLGTIAHDDSRFATRGTSAWSSVPLLVSFPPFSDPSDQIVQIASGTHNSMAVTREGVAYTWGRQVVGELGIGNDDVHFLEAPTVIGFRDKEIQQGVWKATAVSAGGQHCVALMQHVLA